MKLYVMNLYVYGMIVVCANSKESAESIMKEQCVNYDPDGKIDEYDISTMPEQLIDHSVGDM